MLLELWADLEHFIELYGIWAVAGSVFLDILLTVGRWTVAATPHEC